MPLIIDVYNVLHTTGILPPDLAGIGVTDLKRLIAISRYRNEPCRLVCDGVRPRGVGDAGAIAEVFEVSAGGLPAAIPEPSGGPVRRPDPLRADVEPASEARLIWESNPAPGRGQRRKRRRSVADDHGAASIVPRAQGGAEDEVGDGSRATPSFIRGVMESDDRFPQIEVIWSGSGIEADAVIERLIAVSSAPRGLKVVSSDRRILRAARRRRCETVTSDRFLVQLMTDFSGQLMRSDRPLQAFEIPLDQASIGWWLQYLGVRDGEPIALPPDPVLDEEASRRIIEAIGRPPHIDHGAEEGTGSADGVGHRRRGSTSRPAARPKSPASDDVDDVRTQSGSSDMPTDALQAAQHLVQHWFDEDPAAGERLTHLLRQYRDAVARQEGGGGAADAGGDSKAPTLPDRTRSNPKWPSTGPGGDRPARLRRKHAQPQTPATDVPSSAGEQQDGRASGSSAAQPPALGSEMGAEGNAVASGSAPPGGRNRAPEGKQPEIGETSLTRWWLRYFDLDPDDLPDDLK